MEQQMKCVKCGKPAIADGFCESCYLEQHPLLVKAKDIKIFVCVGCRKVLSKGVWNSYKDLDSGIISIIKSSLKLAPGAKVADIELNLPEYKYKPGIKTIGTASVALDLNIKNKSLREEYELPVTVEFTTCNICSKKGTQYFEGILQIRNPNQKILDYIDKNIDFLSKTVNLKTGVDYYLSSNKYLQMFSKKLFTKFGGDLKVSTRLFTRNRQTGKNVYRANVVLRLPDFDIGDILSINNKYVLVKEIKASTISGKDLLTGGPTSADYKKLKYEIACRKEDIQKTTVSRKYPHIEIIHPETYQSVTVKNKRDVQPGEKVKVALIKGFVYLV